MGAALLAGLVIVVVPARMHAQEIRDTLVLRALDLEARNDARGAARLYRAAIAGPDAITALLGLERAYAELGLADSLLAPVTAVAALHPRDATVRSIQLRTLHVLRRRDEMLAAAAQWVRAVPRDAAPYREVARLLIAEGRHAVADSVLREAVRALGSDAGLSSEIAQVRAAGGAWTESARAWRRAVANDHWLAEAAAHSLREAPAPQRDSIRAILLGAPVEPPARLALAGLETRWGSPGRGWDALRDLAADSVTVAAWLAFAERAEAEGRWAHARAALESALRWRDDPAVRLRAAHAALEGGYPAGALALARFDGGPSDSSEAAVTIVPLRVRALSRLARADDAARLATAYDRFLAPGPRAMLARAVAMGWVRAGDLARARAALDAMGDGADSSSAAGWIALFEGDAVSARALLAAGEERSAEVALALAVLSRHRAARTPAIGGAFMALLRADTAAAARGFEAAIDGAPDAASLLLLTAARLRAAGGDVGAAMKGWERVIAAHPASPEAPEALLLLGRAHGARGEAARAIELLERLVLSYPASALVPVARTELEQARRSSPAAP